MSGSTISHSTSGTSVWPIGSPTSGRNATPLSSHPRQTSSKSYRHGSKLSCISTDDHDRVIAVVTEGTVQEAEKDNRGSHRDVDARRPGDPLQRSNCGSYGPGPRSSRIVVSKGGCPEFRRTSVAACCAS